MNLISPESAQLFRIIVGAIIFLYFFIVARAIRQILQTSAFSYVQKINWILLVLFLPCWGMIIYYAINTSKN
jgi:hypothetical protein